MRRSSSLALAVFFVVIAPQACKPAVYSEELHACVVNSKTLAESQACRCNVSKSFNRPCDPTAPTQDLTLIPDAGASTKDSP